MNWIPPEDRDTPKYGDLIKYPVGWDPELGLRRRAQSHTRESSPHYGLFVREVDIAGPMWLVLGATGDFVTVGSWEAVVVQEYKCRPKSR